MLQPKFNHAVHAPVAALRAWVMKHAMRPNRATGPLLKFKAVALGQGFRARHIIGRPVGFNFLVQVLICKIRHQAFPDQPYREGRNINPNPLALEGFGGMDCGVAPTKWVEDQIAFIGGLDLPPKLIQFLCDFSGS